MNAVEGVFGSGMSNVQANGYERRVIVISGRDVGVATYRVGARFSCRVDNVDPGAIIARATGATREEAEQIALASAVVTLDLRDAQAALKRSVEQLRGRRDGRDGGDP